MTPRTVLEHDRATVYRGDVLAVLAGGTVLDPFLGAGTTGIAAVLEGRRIIGAEISDHFADLSARRILVSLELGAVNEGEQLALGATS